MKRAVWLEIIVALIVMMFLYASFSKYFDFGAFQRAMYNQPFPEWFSTLLIVALPPVEIGISIMLIREKTRKKGLVATIVIMTLFTIYIAAIMLHFFPRVPCSCGGLIRLLTWPKHLVFNLFYLLLALMGLKLYNQSQKLNMTAT